MTVSQATARQPSLITSLNNLLSVLDLAGEIINGRAYQFKALPFGLSTAPLEFTVIPKEVKLMAIHKDLRSHQCLDDWLVRARSHQACLQHTQELVNNVSATGLADELREIRAGAQTRLRFCRLPVRIQV